MRAIRAFLLFLAVWLMFGCVSETITTQEADDMTARSELNPRDGWSASGILHAGNHDEHVHLQVQFPDAGYYTVQFSVDAPSPPAAFNVQSKIKWSVAGNDVTRFVSVGNGTTVSGPGQAVNIDVHDVTGGSGGQAYGIGIQVTRGVRPTTMQPPTLQGAGALIPNGGTSTIVVPPGVGVISALVLVGKNAAGDPTPDVTVQQQDIASVIVASYEAETRDDFVPVLPIVTKIVVRNNGAASIQMTLVWGIDG